MCWIDLSTSRRPDGLPSISSNALRRTIACFEPHEEGRAHHDAVLEDYAYLGEGLVDLYEAGGEERFLERAGALAVPLLESFQDHELGGFYTTARITRH